MATGKNKEQFEKWLIEKYFHNLHFNNINDVIGFNNLPFEFQIGVYLAYYDSLEWGGVISVDWRSAFNGDYTFRITSRFHGGVSVCNQDYKDIMETYKEAFKQANELINKQLK